jgi:hypothetical protein
MPLLMISTFFKMKRRAHNIQLVGAGWMLLLFLGLGRTAAAEAGRIRLVRTPQNGIQPQAVTDNRGTVHLLFFKGDPKAGNLFYARRPAGQAEFTQPLQVNDKPGSAVAVGTIRGGQLALGKSGRVHVVWNGSSAVTPDGDFRKTPLLYSRLNDAGSAFEPERNVITYAFGLDGGSSVAADETGHVYVTWHAHVPGGREGESGRAVFLARSNDEGKSFEREIQANPEPTGACGCCGMKSFADDQGRLYVLYRAAEDGIKRDEILMISSDQGRSFRIVNAHPWRVNICPMSSAFLSPAAAGPLAAWETMGQVYFAKVNPQRSKVSNPVSPPGRVRRKHPVAVSNAKGETLLVWTEGTGWNQGGKVAWQVFDQKDQPTANRGSADGVPVWSLAAAVANPDGTFDVIY